MMRKIFKNIAMICLAICVAIGSFFVPLKSDNMLKSAHADNTSYDNITFNSSNIIYSCLGNSDNFNFNDFSGLLYSNASNPQSDLDWLNFSFRLTYDNNRLLALVNGSQGDSYGIVPNNSGTFADAFYEIGTFYFTSSDKSSSYLRKFYYRIDNSFYCTAIGFMVYHESGLNSNVPSLDMLTLEIGNYNTFNFIDADISIFSNSNIVCYSDTNGFKYLFFIPCYQNISINPFMYYDYRQYYYANAFNLDDNQIFQQGYNEGLADNQSTIYNNGYNAGYDIGFDRGKIQGGAEANNYSFLGLIGAVVDAPVSILSSLFNFTFLGINLWSFITSLLTIALILFVVKIFMRR